jgi:hypothetical protein
MMSYSGIIITSIRLEVSEWLNALLSAQRFFHQKVLRPENPLPGKFSTGQYFTEGFFVRKNLCRRVLSSVYSFILDHGGAWNTVAGVAEESGGGGAFLSFHRAFLNKVESGGGGAFLSFHRALSFF